MIETNTLRARIFRHLREPGDENAMLNLVDAYEAMEAEFTAYRAVSNKALRRINAIRNSIVGFQTVNWSAHVYPLVAALNEAHQMGLDADEAKALAHRLLDESKGFQDYEAFLTAFELAVDAKNDHPVVSADAQ